MPHHRCSTDSRSVSAINGVRCPITGAAPIADRSQPSPPLRGSRKQLGRAAQCRPPVVNSVATCRRLEVAEHLDRDNRELCSRAYATTTLARLFLFRQLPVASQAWSSDHGSFFSPLLLGFNGFTTLTEKKKVSWLLVFKLSHGVEEGGLQVGILWVPHFLEVEEEGLQVGILWVPHFLEVEEEGLQVGILGILVQLQYLFYESCGYHFEAA